MWIRLEAREANPDRATSHNPRRGAANVARGTPPLTALGRVLGGRSTGSKSDVKARVSHDSPTGPQPHRRHAHGRRVEVRARSIDSAKRRRLNPRRIRSSIWSTWQPHRSEPEHGEPRALTSRGIRRISGLGFHGPDRRMDLPFNKRWSSGARWPDLPAAPRLRKRRCSVAPRNALCRLGRLLVISLWGSRKAHAGCDERRWSGSGGYPLEGRGSQRGSVWRPRLDTRYPPIAALGCADNDPGVRRRSLRAQRTGCNCQHCDPYR